MPGQDVQDHSCRRGAFVQGLGAGGFHRIRSVGRDHAQDLDHLPVAVWHLAQLALNAPDRWRQFPFLEGSAVPEGAGLAGQHRNIVQRIVDGLSRPKVRMGRPTILPSCRNSTRSA